MNLLDPAWLIHLGTGLLLVGYFIRDELKLRLMIIVSSLVFNAYYWLVPKPPLWDSVMTGFLMVAVNLWVLFQVLLDRTTFRMSEEEKRLLDALSTFTPGQFRKALRLAKWRSVDSDREAPLTVQDEASRSLYFILDGEVAVEKGGHSFTVPRHNFIGEIAFVQNAPASATTRAKPGARYVEWDAAALHALEARDPAFANALKARIADEMAEKLRTSVKSGALEPLMAT
ncbi:MAG: cyclic nucleotide-binding domain-containing protein [Pseudomonadota bacterium]